MEVAVETIKCGKDCCIRLAVQQSQLLVEISKIGSKIVKGMETDLFPADSLAPNAADLGR